MNGIIKSKYLDEYRDIIIQMLDDPYENEIISPSSITYNFFDNDYDILKLKIDNYLDTYVRCVNGFIGRDIMMLKYTAFDLLLFSKILDNNSIDEQSKNQCQEEMLVHFYLFINCLYNVKSKFMSSTNCSIKNKKPIVKDSILSDKGKLYLISIFRDTYSTIDKYCKARNLIVHNNYEIDYNNDTNSIIITLFNFKLTTKEDNLKEHKTPIIFNINDNEIKKIMHSVYSLRKNYYLMLNDSTNIDSKLFLQRYTDENGKIQISIP